MVDQFNVSEAVPGLHVNGKLTLGENGADLAGLAAAYDAYRASLNGKELPTIGGFTGDQRFFIAYGQSRLFKGRQNYVRQIAVSNAHAPDNFRVLTVRNLDAWYKAFGVRPTAALYLPPDKRVRLW